MSAATARLVEKFNQLVQHDLMFVSPKPGREDAPRTEPWQHLICAATRLSQASIIDNKTVVALLDSFERTWVRPYNAPDMLESDQESGLASDEAKIYLDRLRIKCRLKGVSAHVQMCEKHQDLLRQVFLRIFSQASLEGLPITKEHCLSVALTAKNNLFTVGDTTPMMAVFGRQHPVLPDLDASAPSLDDSNAGPELISRGRHRLQEIGTQSMVEATAQARMRIAANSKSRRPAQDATFRVGDDVEFFRKQQAKDVTGWRGPGEVLKIDSDGTVHIQWQGSPVTCRWGDVRSALAHLAMFLCLEAYAADGNISALETVMNMVSRMSVGTQQHVGIADPSGTMSITKASLDNPRLLTAVLRAASCDLHLENCLGARLVRGLQHLSGIKGYVDSLLIVWPHTDQHRISHWRLTPDNAISFKEFHSDPKQLCAAQFLLTDSDDIHRAQQHPNIPHLGNPSPHGSTPAGMDASIHTPDADKRGDKRNRDRADSGNPAPNISRCLAPDPVADKATDIISRAAQEAQQPSQDIPVPDDDDDDLMEDPELFAPDPNATADTFIAMTTNTDPLG